jgi:flagellar biosynthesis GTPase FlhF
LFLIL